MFQVMKRVNLILVVLLLALPLAGCEQLLDELSPARRTPVNPAATPELVATQPPAVDPTRALPVEDLSQITLWLPPAFDPDNGSPQGKLLKKQLQSFSEANSLTVNVRVKALSGPSSLLESLTAASLAAPGSLPGVVILPRSDLAAAIESGLLMPLDVETPAPYQADYFALAGELATVKDTAYGIPFAADALCIAYNSLQVVYPPKLWREFLQLGKVLAFPAAAPNGLMMLQLYQDKGGEFTRTETQVTVEEEALQQTLLFLADGANKNVFPYWLTDFTTFADSWQALRDARATFALIWASQYLEETPANAAILKVPSFGEGSFTLADGWVIVFPETSPERFKLNQQLAADLVEPEFQGEWTESAGLIPLSPAALSAWKNAEAAATLLEIAASAHLLPPNDVLYEVGPLFTQATIEMLRRQTSYIESSNRIIKALAE